MSRYAVDPGLRCANVDCDRTSADGRLCRVPTCVNPDHLEPVTSAENTRRGLTRLACKRGHFFTPDNTYYRPDRRGRQCRACIALRPRLRDYIERVELPESIW